MENKESKKEKPTGQTLSVWVSNELMNVLDVKSKELGRTKSWLVNFVLRDRLGMIPEGEFKGKDIL